MDKKIPDGVVLTAAYALSKEWNLHYPDAVRMAALVLSVGQQHPEWQTVGVEWIMELADEYDAKGHHDRAYDLRILAQQPTAVDEAMVERACRHWYAQWDEADRASKMLWAEKMYDLLIAARGEVT